MCMFAFVYIEHEDTYSTGQKKVNVSTVRYAPGALLVRSRFAFGTLEFGGAVRLAFHFRPLPST